MKGEARSPFLSVLVTTTYAELFQNRLDNGGRIFLTNKLVFTKLLINKVFLSITWYDKQALDSIREDQDLEVLQLNTQDGRKPKNNLKQQFYYQAIKIS